MPPATEREIKRAIYKKLDPYPREPIPYGSSLYVQRYETERDPIEQLRNKIDLAGVDSIQFLSGCSGSGKTTELARLRSLLEDDGYIVFHANALEYLNPAQPLEIEELIVIIGAAFSEHVEELLGKDPAREGYLTRFWNYLSRTEVQIEEAGVKLKGPTAEAEFFGLKAGLPSFEVDFKTKLRTTDTFRQLIRKVLAGRLDEHKRNLDQFIADARAWLIQARPQAAGVVLLFDSLEQIQGGISEEDRVMSSVQRIFSQHRELLRLEEIHLVYTVPPWLRYSAPGAISLEKTLSCVKLWQYDKADGARQEYAHGWSIMREIITKRVGVEQMADVFGSPDAQGNYCRLDELIEYCGGHFRDLLYLVQEALASSPALEIRNADVEVAKSDLRDQFSIDDASAEWLLKIAETHQPCRPDSRPETVAEFTRFLDRHLVLLFTNGDDWYDVHPIIREQVEKIAARLREEKKVGSESDAAGG